MKFIDKLLGFDHRVKPLDVERSTAGMTEQVWDEHAATESSAKISSRHASPPLVYESSVFETPPKTIRGMTVKILKGTMRSDALQLLEDAQKDANVRREFGREPYVHPAVLKLENDPNHHSAFIRDVSMNGVGLIHFVPIEPQRITVLTRRYNDEVINVLVDITWCVPCGEGCYMSGGTFE